MEIEHYKTHCASHATLSQKLFFYKQTGEHIISKVEILKLILFRLSICKFSAEL